MRTAGVLRAAGARCAFLASAALALPAAATAETYQAPEQFVAEAFGGAAPEPSALWFDDALRAQAERTLGHAVTAARVRYWRSAERTVWILEEIGKEQPITAGFVVGAGGIERARVLIYRESRGWEVRLPAFTRQFDGARLNSAGELDRAIDGISGATLSVGALKRMARLALLYHARVAESDGSRPH